MIKGFWLSETITIIFIILSFKKHLLLGFSLSGMTLQDLEKNDYSGFVADANLWSASLLRDGSTKVSFCKNLYLLGGYNILGSSSAQASYSFSRTYNALPTHDTISLVMTFQAIDSWDYDDSFQVQIDTTTLNGWSIPNGNTQAYCGLPSVNDFPPIQLYITMPHSALSLTLTVISQLTQDSTDESFGFRDVSITFYQTTSTTPITPTICGVSPKPLSSKACACPTQKFYQDPLNSGTCLSCDPNCASCNGQNSNNCLSCDPGKYLSSGQCLNCHASCATCSGGNNNQCLTCYGGNYLATNATCMTSCPYPLIQTSNATTEFCESPCPLTNFAYWDQTCSTNCDFPLNPIPLPPFKVCEYVCKPYEYLYWDQTCSTRCPFPLDQRFQNNRSFCDYKCLTTEYLHWDATCRTSCNFPLNSYISHSRNFCTNPCKTSEYLYWNQSCITTCETPLQIRKDANDVYCDFPCLSNQVAYWDGTCSSSCLSPLVLKSEGVSMVRYFCLFPCKIDEFLYWNGTCSKACIPPLTYTYQNSRSFCHYPCTSVQYLYWNGSCQSSCSSPFSIRIEAGYKYCDYICSSSEYLFWNGSCLPTCKTPLVIRMQGADKFCDYPCNTNDFLYWNGTCSSQCLSPLFSKTEGTPSRKFCDYECANSDDYLYWNGSCAASCDLPFSIRLESTKKYCDYPCSSSSPIPQYLYWNGTCSSSCSAPLQIRVDSGITRYCEFSCSSLNDFLYWNGTCSHYCPSPLTQYVEGSGNVARHFCKFDCNSGEYLYWNRACLSTCPLPLRIRIEGNKQFCDQPCKSAFEYYYPGLGKCKEDCNPPYFSDQDLTYPTCLFHPINEDGWFARNFLTATAKEGHLTLITVAKILNYIRYLDIKMSPRLQKLVVNKGRNILSLKCGFFLADEAKSNFISSPSPSVFAKHDLHSRFLVNFWENLISMIIIIGAAISFTVCEKISKVYKWNICQGIFGRLRVITRWNFLLIFISINIDDIILYSSQEFRTLSSSEHTGYTILSFLLCLSVIIMTILYLFGIYWIVKKVNLMKSTRPINNNKITDKSAEELKFQDFQIFFRGLKTNSFLKRSFYLIYVFRITLPMLIASYLYTIPLAQMILQIIISVSILLFILLMKPLEKRINHLQLIILESIVLVINCCILILTILDISGSEVNDFGIVLGDIVIFGNFSINVLILVFLFIKILKEASAIGKSIKGLSGLHKTAWIQLLALPIQQGGMGFEEMIDGDKYSNMYIQLKPEGNSVVDWKLKQSNTSTFISLQNHKDASTSHMKYNNEDSFAITNESGLYRPMNKAPETQSKKKYINPNNSSVHMHFTDSKNEINTLQRKKL